ncbi:MAG: VacJ family lipoprotein [Thiohalomonadales bacterium]
MVKFKFFCLGLAIYLLTACASIEGPLDENDPYESYNRSMNSFNVSFDDYILKPVAESYRDYVPNPIQTGINNFFSNLNDITVIANDLLQFNFVQLVQDASRFAFNTTAGFLGIFDVATSMDLPKHNEDFGQTFAVWGYKDSAYLILPVIGLAGGTIRDSIGFGIDTLYLNVLVPSDLNNIYWGAIIIKNIDVRANLLNASKVLEQAALDPYIFKRESYLSKRKSLIYNGNPPIAKIEFPKDDIDLELELELELEMQKQLTN